MKQLYKFGVTNYEVITDWAFAVGVAGANIKAKEVIWNYELVAQSAIMSYELFNYEVITDWAFAVGVAGANIKAKEEVPLTNGRKLQIINFKVQTSKFKEYIIACTVKCAYKYNIVQ